MRRPFQRKYHSVFDGKGRLTLHYLPGKMDDSSQETLAYLMDLVCADLSARVEELEKAITTL